MTYYIRNGNQFKVASEDSIDIQKELPVGNYIIKEDPYGSLYLESIDSFDEPPKLYGSTKRTAERIIRTYLDRPNNTGVLLTGEKGSGKSLLAKTISIDSAAIGMPTIVINSPWVGDRFNKFLQDIQQDCVILFDEFEKVYDKQSQETILTLLDGVFPSKKLFVLTCNDKSRIDSHMTNRPGRIFYLIEFSGLEETFIREYCEEKMNNKAKIDKLCTIISCLFSEFNFDMLKAVVEELNRYDEEPQEVIQMLNVKPEFSYPVTYNIIIEGIDKNDVVQHPDSWRGNPMTTSFSLVVSYTKNDEENWNECHLNAGCLQKFDAQTGRFFYKVDDTIIILEKEKIQQYDYYKAL